MKCKFCKESNAEYVTVSGGAICEKCVQENNYVICVNCGKVVPIEEEKYPYSESLCQECINKIQ